MSDTSPSSLQHQSLSEVWAAHRIWSVRTFGEDKGPVGALLHLKEEIAEVLEDLTDTHEYVDCMFLLMDAISRAGITQDDFLTACNEKQSILYTRTYPKTPEGVPSYHAK